jgi:high-affinity nickel-transport protein
MQAASLTTGPRRSRLRSGWRSLHRGERRIAIAMALAVGALHALGFAILFLVVAPARAHAGAAGALTAGVGLTAYTLGMRHAFDADHIAAIDNTTRKLMADGKRPLSVGFWFSLGHSSVVFALTLLISLGVKTLDGSVKNPDSHLHQVTSTVGTLVSGGFLYLIAALNLVILVGIARAWRELRSGRYDQRELERRLDQRGLMNRLLGKTTARINAPVHMYPIGLLFGLGFDTATEVALLVLAGGAAGVGLPWYAILCLPILFAAGMSLLDSIDGMFMSVAYAWAFTSPVRKVFYNLTITALSVAVALVIGTLELGGLAASNLKLSGSFFNWLENVNINLLGFVIAGMFLITWVIALAIWHFGRIEQRTPQGSQGPSRVRPDGPISARPGQHRDAARAPGVGSFEGVRRTA